MAFYDVAEIFSSINGEGILAGQLAVFVRFKGCNLDCSFCDTKWANAPDTISTRMTEYDIYNAVKAAKITNITLTGGEPLLQSNIKNLLELLGNDTSLNIEVETNGSIDLKNFVGLQNPPSFTMDYKLPSSGMEDFMNPDNFSVLSEKDTVKFVVGCLEDMERAKDVIEKYELIKKCHVYLSPVFEGIEPSEIVDYMLKNNLNGVNLQLQMHKLIWDPNARGV